MLGELEPDEGSILILGEDIRHFKDWHRIGYVPQNAAGRAAGFPATAAEIVGLNLYREAGEAAFLKAGASGKGVARA